MSDPFRITFKCKPNNTNILLNYFCMCMCKSSIFIPKSSFFVNPKISAALVPLFFGFLFLVCIPSLRIANGRLTPCNLKYNPHALHTGSPSLLRRHNVVVRVPQLVQHNPKRRVAVCDKADFRILLGVPARRQKERENIWFLILTSLLLGFINGLFIPFILW